MEKKMGKPVVLKKQCKCYSTASGPRIIFEGAGNPKATDPRTNPEAVTALITFVALAYDACDKPWVS